MNSSQSQSGGRAPGLAASLFTLANALTAVRLVSAPLCAFAILDGASVLATVLFCVAIATDFADGPLARRRGEVSPFGGLLDHSTDALFVSLGLAALSCHGVVPVLLPILVATAFVQYALDSKTLMGHPLRASWLGRWNGILYFVPLGTPIIRDAFALSWPPDSLVWWMGWGLVVSTIASMGNRAVAYVRLSRAS